MTFEETTVPLAGAYFDKVSCSNQHEQPKRNIDELARQKTKKSIL